MSKPLINPDDYEIVTTPAFKLKNYPENRRVQIIDLKGLFGVIPEIIAVEKIPTSNNKLMVRGFIKKSLLPKQDDSPKK